MVIRVLSSDSERSHGALGYIVVDLNTAIVDVNAQRSPPGESISHRFS
jgi:hypothetical protein